MPIAGAEGVQLTACGGRLAGVDVADNDDVDMSLLLTVPLSVTALVSRCGLMPAYPMLTVLCGCVWKWFEVLRD
jgi:hypothetical protein